MQIPSLACIKMFASHLTQAKSGGELHIESQHQPLILGSHSGSNHEWSDPPDRLKLAFFIN